MKSANIGLLLLCIAVVLTIATAQFSNECAEDSLSISLVMYPTNPTSVSTGVAIPSYEVFPPFFLNNVSYFNISVLTQDPAYNASSYIVTVNSAAAQGPYSIVVPSVPIAVWGFSSALSFVNVLVITVSNKIVATGESCTNTMTFDIHNPSVAVKGDPSFVGLRGQSYQVHGIDGGIYNLISDKTVQVNSRFAYLDGPRACPIIPSTRRKSVACWAHAGSYLDNIAMFTQNEDRILIESGPASVGFESIYIDSKSLKVGDSISFASGSLHYNSTHECTVTVGDFTLTIENSDGFVNIRSLYIAPGKFSSLASHGLLGQTWRNTIYSSSLRVIQGEVDDYLIIDNDMFGLSFPYNQF